MRDTNPIKEWLARVAIECGNPEAMYIAAQGMKIANTRKLIDDHATLWARKLELQKKA